MYEHPDCFHDVSSFVCVVITEMQEQRSKSMGAVTDLKPPPAEKLTVERVQGKNGSVKRIKSPITATSYTVASLQTATNSFSQEFLIGEGSLGRVYKAEFPNGKVVLLCYGYLLNSYPSKITSNIFPLRCHKINAIRKIQVFLVSY